MNDSIQDNVLLFEKNYGECAKLLHDSLTKVNSKVLAELDAFIQIAHLQTEVKRFEAEYESESAKYEQFSTSPAAKNALSEILFEKQNLLKKEVDRLIEIQKEREADQLRHNVLQQKLLGHCVGETHIYENTSFDQHRDTHIRKNNELANALSTFRKTPRSIYTDKEEMKMVEMMRRLMTIDPRPFTAQKMYDELVYHEIKNNVTLNSVRATFSQMACFRAIKQFGTTRYILDESRKLDE